MEDLVRCRQRYLQQHGDRLKPEVGDVVIALLRQRVEVLSVGEKTADVEVIPESALADGGRVVVRGVPFDYISESKE